MYEESMLVGGLIREKRLSQEVGEKKTKHGEEVGYLRDNCSLVRSRRKRK